MVLMRQSHLILLFLSAFLSTFAFAEAPFCGDVLKALSRFETPTLFSEPAKFFKSKRTGQEMAYQIVHPANGKTEYFVLAHGLGNAMGTMQPLAKRLIADGYGVLLMDLHGHGRTLGRMMQTMESIHSRTFPDTFKHEDNVLDIRDLILDQNIHEFHFIGHSHGGGVGYAVASEFDRLQKAGELNFPNAPRILSVHLLAPYVSRIDKFLADIAGTPEFWVQETSKNLVKAGMDANQVDAVLDPVFEYFFNAMKASQYFVDVIKNFLGGQKMIDKLIDPSLDAALHKKFASYFTARFESITKHSLTSEERQLVELQVTVSLIVVKSNRDFDLLDRTRQIPQVDVPVQIIGARADTLVPIAQLKEFFLRLKQYGLTATLSFVGDVRAGHDIVETNVNEVYSLIMKELKREKGTR